MLACCGASSQDDITRLNQNFECFPRLAMLCYYRDKYKTL